MSKARNHFEACSILEHGELIAHVKNLQSKIYHDPVCKQLFIAFLERYVRQPDVRNLLADTLASDYLQASCMDRKVHVRIPVSLICSCVMYYTVGHPISPLKAMYAYCQRENKNSSMNIALKPYSDKVDTDLAFLATVGYLRESGEYQKVVAVTADTNEQSLLNRQELIRDVIKDLSKKSPKAGNLLNYLSVGSGEIYLVNVSSGNVKKLSDSV